MAYHINDLGEPGKCRAKIGNCPFATIDEHYSTPQAAREAFEERQGFALSSVSKKTLVLSDIDGTLVKSSLVLTNAVSLHDKGVMDLGELPEKWTNDMKNEALIRDLAESYREALSGRTVGFAKAKNHIKSLLADDGNFYSTLRRLIEHKQKGDEVVLISGSPDFLVGPFAEKFGFKYHASTYHTDNKGRFTGEITLMAGAQAKEAVIQDLNIDSYDTVVGLGDTASDGPLLAAAHQSVLVAPTDETLELLRAKNIRIDEIVEE